MITGCGPGRAFAAFVFHARLRGWRPVFASAATAETSTHTRQRSSLLPTSGASLFVRCGQVSAWQVGYTVGYTGFRCLTKTRGVVQR